MPQPAWPSAQQLRPSVRPTSECPQVCWGASVANWAGGQVVRLLQEALVRGLWVPTAPVTRQALWPGPRSSVVLGTEQQREVVGVGSCMHRGGCAVEMDA